jgi:hypothetical protein
MHCLFVARTPATYPFASVQEPESAQSPLSAKPPSATRDTGLASPLEDQQNKDYWPITWRVVGGGVKMALPGMCWHKGFDHGVDTRLDDEKAPPAFAGDSERALALVNTGPTVFVEDQCLAADTSKLGVPVASIYVKGHSARKNMSISIPGPIPFVGLEVENEAKARARSTPASPSREPVDLPKVHACLARARVTRADPTSLSFSRPWQFRGRASPLQIASAHTVRLRWRWTFSSTKFVLVYVYSIRACVCAVVFLVPQSV